MDFSDSAGFSGCKVRKTAEAVFGWAKLPDIMNGVSEYFTH